MCDKAPTITSKTHHSIVMMLSEYALFWYSSYVCCNEALVSCWNEFLKQDLLSYPRWNARAISIHYALDEGMLSNSSGHLFVTHGNLAAYRSFYVSE